MLETLFQKKLHANLQSPICRVYFFDVHHGFSTNKNDFCSITCAQLLTWSPQMLRDA